MIQSHLIEYPINGRQFLFYDSVLDGKHVFSACGVGKVQKNDASLSEVARSTLFALTEYVEKSAGAVGNIRFQEIATVKAAPVRIKKAFISASEKDVLFFVCRSPDIYDVAVKVLNVQWSHDKSPH